MRLVSGILAVAALVNAALAAPATSQSKSEVQRRDEVDARNACMSGSQAQQVATNFGHLISAYSATLANQTLTANYVDYSDSVNTLINNGCTSPQTLGQATFTSRAAFESGQASQPNVPFEQLNLWYTCNDVILR